MRLTLAQNPGITGHDSHWGRKIADAQLPRTFVSLSFAKGRASDGFPLGMEDFIRQSIKDFDYPECTVFRQLVKIVAPVEKVSVANTPLGQTHYKNLQYEYVSMY